MSGSPVAGTRPDGKPNEANPNAAPEAPPADAPSSEVGASPVASVDGSAALPSATPSSEAPVDPGPAPEPTLEQPAPAPIPQSSGAGAKKKRFSDLDPAERDALLTHGSRILLLAVLLGGALATWTQLAFRAPWLDEFLLENTLEPGRRDRLIRVLVLGMGLGGLGSAGLIAWRRRAGLEIESLERWLWFLSPLLLLPLAPVFFRAKAWVGRYDVILPTLILVLLVFEQLVVRALKNVPDAVRAYFDEARGQIPPPVRRWGAPAVVIAAAAAYAAFFIFFTIRWHYKLRTGNYDLSINNNLLFGGLHGHFLESPVVFPKDPPRYLANHAKFGAYVFLPIYALFPRPETLLVIQSLFVGFGAVPLFAFARRHLSEVMALVIVLAYLAYYPLHGASFSEFQAVPLTSFFVFTIAWAADAKRYRILAVALVIALAMREDIAVGLAVLGGFLLLTGYRPLPGLVIAGVSTAYFLLLRFYVMEQAGSWWFPNMYKDIWADGEKGFRSVIKTMITNPTFLLSKVIVAKKLEYVMHLFVPLAFLPVRRWYLWAALIPGALLTLLVTNYDPPTTFSFHYIMHWAPYLFMAAVLALKSIRDTGADGPARARAALATVAAASLVLSYNYGAFPRREGSFKAGFSKIEFTYSDAERARYAELLEIIKDIPKDAPVAATEKCGPHVSSRLSIFTMRNGPQTGEYILASARELKLSKTRPTLKEALETGQYGVLRRVGDFALMKKGHSTAGNAQLIQDWEL
ncbi:MAG TPA: DUF2079 domain-containing protein [Polyangiaceae bacterium]